MKTTYTAKAAWVTRLPENGFAPRLRAVELADERIARAEAELRAAKADAARLVKEIEAEAARLWTADECRSARDE
jgi:hypothetical protein